MGTDTCFGGGQGRALKRPAGSRDLREGGRKGGSVGTSTGECSRPEPKWTRLGMAEALHWQLVRLGQDGVGGSQMMQCLEGPCEEFEFYCQVGPFRRRMIGSSWVLSSHWRLIQARAAAGRTVRRLF